jgi:hypothetical protein
VAVITWGDAGTWASAAASFAAVMAALGIALAGGIRERRRLRRFQAEQITAWLDGEVKTAEILRVVVGNASQQSAYQVIVTLVAIQGAWRKNGAEGGVEHRTFLWQVPPGQRSSTITFAGHGMFLRFGVELAFQDAAGQCWRRLADGRLTPISANPLEYYKLGSPMSWEDNTFGNGSSLA